MTNDKVAATTHGPEKEETPKRKFTAKEIIVLITSVVLLVIVVILSINLANTSQALGVSQKTVASQKVDIKSLKSDLATQTDEATRCGVAAYWWKQAAADETQAISDWITNLFVTGEDLDLSKASADVEKAKAAGCDADNFAGSES